MEKLFYKKCLDFNCIWGPFYKKSSNSWLLVNPNLGHPEDSEGQGWALWQNGNNKKFLKFNFSRGLFYGKSENSKKLAQPSPHAPTAPIFSGRGPKFKIPLPTFCSPRHPNSKKIWHYPTTWKPWEEIDLAETPFFGVRAWTRGPGPLTLRVDPW